MEELFIWFYSTPNALPKGVPATVMTNVLPDNYFCYQNALVIKKSLKEEIEKLCYAPEIYPVSEFPEVYNTCLKW